MSEKRLIDANALLTHQVEADRMGAMLVVGKGHILNAPTIAAEPVRHACWIEIILSDPEENTEGLTYWHCSDCGGIDKGKREPRFCRSCGARMDAKEDSDG